MTILLDFIERLLLARASLVAQMAKHLPAVQETWVRSLGWKDPLEKEMAAHSSILAWRIPWTAEPGGLQSMAHKESDTTERPALLLSRHCANLDDFCKSSQKSYEGNITCMETLQPTHVESGSQGWK